MTWDESHVSVGGLLALGLVLRKKSKIKEEERRRMNYAGRTQIEEGSKWLKKKKRKKEVRENLVVGREDQGRQISKEDGSWKTQQVEKYTNGCFGALRGKGVRTGWRSPENAGQVDLGFWI